MPSCPARKLSRYRRTRRRDSFGPANLRFCRSTQVNAGNCLPQSPDLPCTCLLMARVHLKRFRQRTPLGLHYCIETRCFAARFFFRNWTRLSILKPGETTKAIVPSGAGKAVQSQLLKKSRKCSAATFSSCPSLLAAVQPNSSGRREPLIIDLYSTCARVQGIAES